VVTGASVAGALSSASSLHAANKVSATTAAAVTRKVGRRFMWGVLLGWATRSASTAPYFVAGTPIGCKKSKDPNLLRPTGPTVIILD
jgi:hypothetical protein